MKQIKAFTLVELLIVMAIIGMLIAIAIWGIGLAQQGARNTQRTEVASELVAAFASYYGKYNTQPALVCVGHDHTGACGLSAIDLTSASTCGHIGDAGVHNFDIISIPGSAKPDSTSSGSRWQSSLSHSFSPPIPAASTADTIYIIGYSAGVGNGLKICAELEGGGYADMGDPHNDGTACP